MEFSERRETRGRNLSSLVNETEVRLRQQIFGSGPIHLRNQTNDTIARKPFDLVSIGEKTGKKKRHLSNNSITLPSSESRIP